MSNASNVDQLFHRIHLFIAEGQVDMALATLAHVSANNPRQENEIAYVRAWCATLSGNWDAAAAFLHPTREDTNLQVLGQTERRRRIYYLLLLGQWANKLGYYEEATRHYTQCIRLLDERRMNILSVRIQARCGLGYAYTQLGFYAIALAHYEDACQLSGPESTHPDTLDMYAGLCTAHRHLGHFEQALLYGEKALKLCTDQDNPDLAGRMHYLLGQAYYQMRSLTTATSHYTQALDLAKHVDQPECILNSLTALATVHLEAGQFEEAQRCYEQGLVYQARISDARLVGALYIIGGKIAEAGQQVGMSAQVAQEAALTCYQQAEVLLTSVEAKTELAEVYGRLAQLLEVSGRQNEALAYWKAAYALYARPEGTPVA